jgi:hypothetical protein
VRVAGLRVFVNLGWVFRYNTDVRKSAFGKRITSRLWSLNGLVNIDANYTESKQTVCVELAFSMTDILCLVSFV